MSPSENEDDTKKTGLRPDPLCLFCFPDDSPTRFGKKTYIPPLPIKEPEIRYSRKIHHHGTVQQPTSRLKSDTAKQKEEIWLRRRTEARIRRRRMREPIRNLKAYLLTSVKNENVPQKTLLPSLYEVLETVKDAWSSPSSKKISLLRDEDKKPLKKSVDPPQQSKMKDSQNKLQFSCQLLNRRYSMPEELMRKYSVSKEISEESETNKTMVEMTSSSSSSTLEQEETARRNFPDRNSKAEEFITNIETVRLPQMADASQQTNDTEEKQEKPKEAPKRVTQHDYYTQGKRIIKVKTELNAEKGLQVGVCTCRSEKVSSATLSAKEETDSSGTSDSIPSSSPMLLPKRESSSGNLSSESDYIQCTCRELSSSSTDPFRSGQSTLSQTVSDKTVSTQDSTMSMNSVSTRGSTASDNSNLSTPEVERTSAKETTTSPDFSPRTPRNNMNRKNRRRDKFGFHDHKKTCPRYNDNRHSRNFLSVNHTKQCPVHSESLIKTTVSCGTNTEPQTEAPEAKKEVEVPETSHNSNILEKNIHSRIEKTQNSQSQHSQPFILQQYQPPPEPYKWAKLTPEELYMMQQLRHKKLIENQRNSLPLPPEPKKDPSIGICGTGSSYKDTEYIDEPIMIPRYSALPRTLSMLVNTSSGDTSIQSDSDNQSLADSLEDQPTTHVHKLYFDTKKESKPVRGDVNYVEDTKLRHKQPRGRAFFVSIKDPYGEDEMLENIEKIPQPPEKIKNLIFQRHLNICAKHKQRHKADSIPEGQKKVEKKRKFRKTKNEGTETTPQCTKTNQEESKRITHKHQKKKEDGENQVNKPKRKEDRKAEKSEGQIATNKRKRETKEQKGNQSSKIPVLVSSRSTSSSPEREEEIKNKQSPIRPKLKLRREKETKVENMKERESDTNSTSVETTQILEITHTGKDLSLQKPQAVIHPSQVPFNDSKFVEKDQLTIPPLIPNLGLPVSFRQRQLLLAQVRRSPISKYRQRFEVIPEEKSSSLSSAEEKNAKEKNCTTRPVLKDEKPEKNSFQSFNVNEVSDLIVARITDKELETLPYVKSDENQKIILFSSGGQNSNSTKGRDALIAMNREDFNRLAKGWMNFYKLNETLDNSENEENPSKTSRLGKPKENKPPKIENKAEENKSNVHLEQVKQNKTDKENKNKDNFSEEKEDQTDKCLKSKEEKKQTKSNRSQQTDIVRIHESRSEPQLNEDIRFHSSNTILRTEKKTSPTSSGRSDRRRTGLPLLSLPHHRSCESLRCSTTKDTLPRVSKCLEDDDTDSDSTDYLEPPSPRVPPLPLADFPSDATLSSSDSELDDSKLQANQSMKYFQAKKRGGTNRTRTKKENSFETWRSGKKKNSGWSVTVAGTVEMSRSAPDLEMRLSFPKKGGPPIVSQSDSGFAEDSNNSKLSESLRDLEYCTSRKDQPVGSGKLKQEWMVKVKNPKKGSLPELNKPPKNSSQRLPDLESSHKNTKKVLKECPLDDEMKRKIEKKILVIWPQVQEIIKKEFLTESGRLVMELEDDIADDYCLSVRGSAVSLERKPKPQTMTERDVTRRYTSREENEETK